MVAPSPGATKTLAGRRILVAEDETLLADELIDELEKIGAVVVGPFASVTQALEAIEREPRLDGALLNVHLRGAVSFPVADRLNRRGVPLLFVTGNDVFARERYPAVTCLPKPFDMPRLVEALSALLIGRTE